MASSFHLAWLGPEGLAELGRRCLAKASYARRRLTAIDGVEGAFGDRPFFKEFVVRLPRPAADVRDALVDRGFLPGVPLPDDPGALLVAVTERRTRGQIDAFAEALEEVLR